MESSICDYITLFFKDGINDREGTQKWDIPLSSYYYQTRGTMCLVSLADATLQSIDKGDLKEPVMIAYDGAFNGTTAEVDTTDPLIPNDMAFLGNISVIQQRADSMSDDSIFQFRPTQPIQLLVAARPTTVRLHFVKPNKSAVDFDTFSSYWRGSVTLKFTYLSPDEESRVNAAVSYNPAFLDNEPAI